MRRTILFMTYILTVLGLVLVIEGLPYFIFPIKIKEWANSLQDIPDGTLRIMGLISMAGGLLLVYLGRRVF